MMAGFERESTMWINRRRLEADLLRWRQQGWVTPAGHEKIAAELASSGRGISLPSALAILAVVLFGFAAISFVAAHWDTMPRLARLGLLLSLIAAGYVTAGYFARQGAEGFADSAVVFACAMFGVSIMLISQMFHIDGHPPDAVALWAIGAFAAGVMLASLPALAFSMALVSVWAIMETGERQSICWPFLAAWLGVTAAFAWYRWSPGFHLAALPLAVFTISAGYLPPLEPGHWIVVMVAVVVGGLAIATMRMLPDLAEYSLTALTYALVVGLAGLFAIQFIEKTTTAQLVIVAAATLILLLAIITFGLRENHRGLIWVGYLGFAGEIFSLYWKTLGGLLGNSLFFLIAGVLVAAFAGVAWRIAARQTDEEVIS